jgi:hypothetical protein
MWQVAASRQTHDGSSTTLSGNTSPLRQVWYNNEAELCYYRQEQLHRQGTGCGTGKRQLIAKYSKLPNIARLHHW